MMSRPFTRFIGLACLFALAAGGPAPAQTELFRGGDLTWDTTTANWGGANGGPYSGIVWNNAVERRAVFVAGAAATQTATLAEPITAHSLRFAATGWTVTANTLTLAGTANPGAGTVEVGDGNTATVNSILAGTVGLTKTGGGTLVLSGANTFTGPVGVTGGVLSIDLSTRLGATGLITLDGGTLRNTNPGNAGSFVAAGRGIAVGPTGGTVDYTSSGAGTVSIYAGTITGTGTLTKAGAGEFRYQGAGTQNSTFTKLVVTEGLFRLGSVAGSNFETGFGAAPTAPLADAVTLNGGSIGTSYAVTLSVNRGITLGANGGSINASAAGTITVPGVITRAGTLTKPAAGTVALSGANTYTGGTTVGSGTLLVSNTAGSGTGSGAVTVSGATTTVTNNGGIAGAVTVNGGTLNGTGTHAGAVTVNAGGTVRGAAGTGTGNLTFTNDVTINGAAGTGGALATQLAVSGGAVTANSQLVLSGATSDLNLVPTTGKFRVTLLNDAGLTPFQQYNIRMATAAGLTNFQRAGSGTDAFTAADFDVVSGSASWSFQNLILERANLTELRLTFTPVPEPAAVLAVAAAGLAAARLLRRRRV